MDKKPIILSGIQPSGNLCIANYMGAIKNWVSLQNDYDSIFLIVDLHSLSVKQTPSELRQRCLSFAAQYIACGIDPNKSTIAIQSHISQHVELAWVLSSLTYMGELNRMTQFKDKSKKNEQNINAALFTYPILMASDILLYQADLVPVGQDQKQHLELTRDIAQKFNNEFKTDLFPIPEPLIFGEATKVMSLRDGSKKMSKSDLSDYSRIMLNDSVDIIAQKIKKAKTDPYPLPENLKDAKIRPEAYNLLSIFAALSDKSTEETINSYSGKEFAKFKEDLSALVIEKMTPISKEMEKLMDDQSYIDSIIKNGKEKASKIADSVLHDVYEVIGFVKS